MKVVVCKNCGAKYQLDDADDINAFECSICTGSLEELDGSNKTNSPSADSEGYDDSYSQNYESDSVIVCCQNCGLKFKLDKSDDIREFECVSCDGSLRYLDDELNELYDISPLPEIVDNSNHEVEIIDDNESISSSIFNSSDSTTDEIVVEHDVGADFGSGSVDEIVVEHDVVPEFDEIVVDEESQLESIENQVHEVEVIEGFEKVDVGSVEKNIVDSNFDFEEDTKSEDDESRNNVVDTVDAVGAVETATVVSVATNNIDESEIIQRTNKEPRTLSRKSYSQKDNNINKNKSLTFNNIEEYGEYKSDLFRTYVALNESLKKEYISDLDKQVSTLSKRTTINKNNSDINAPQMEYSQMSYKNLVKSRKEPTSKIYLIPIIVGVVVIIVGVVIFILIKNMLILTLIALGILLIVLGIIMNINKEGSEVRTKIIRERLEELPEEFYLFYFTKPPYAKDGLNHVIVGPTGIYTILTQRYASKEDKDKQKSDAEIDDLIAGPSDIKNYMDNRNRLELTGGYDDNQTRFQFGNEEIQFDYNNKIKHKSLTLNEDLAIFLDKSGFRGVYIEPLIGFINNDVAIINVVLTNEDLFMDELLNKIANGPRRLDPWTVMRIASLLSKYSVNCALDN